MSDKQIPLQYRSSNRLLQASANPTSGVRDLERVRSAICETESGESKPLSDRIGFEYDLFIGLGTDWHSRFMIARRLGQGSANGWPVYSPGFPPEEFSMRTMIRAHCRPA